jgi:hypothetical protein
MYVNERLEEYMHILTKSIGKRRPNRLVRRVLMSTLQRTMIIFDSKQKSLVATCGCSAYTHLTC